MRLLAANVLVFVLQQYFGSVANALVFVPALVLVRPWTLVSYMFLHAGLSHILFNMLGLFFFGPRLEARLGSRAFLGLYFISGIAGALATFAFSFSTPIIGASAGVFGVMLAFAMFWPRERIYIWGVLPIEARWMVVGMTVLALVGSRSSASGIAHFAHLGGFAGGWLFLKVREWRSPARRFQAKVHPAAVRPVGEDALRRWSQIPLENVHEVNREEIHRLLAKAQANGVRSLTVTERETLDRFTPE